MATGSKRLRNKLACLKKNDIIQMVIDMHGRHADIDAYIDRFLLKNNPEALAESLLQEIVKLGAEREFIEYSASFGFAAQLQQQLEDLQQSLLPDYPLIAAELIPAFIDIQDRILMRCDDSAGVVHQVFIEASSLLLASIRLARGQERFDSGYWLSRFDQWRKHDPFQTYLAMLARSQGAFDEPELRHLAWRFEHALKSHSKVDSSDEAQFRRLQEARIGLKGLAKALGDLDLYADSICGAEIQVTAADRREIAGMYLEHGQPAQALEHLQKIAKPDRQVLQLMLDAWLTLGDQEQQLNAQTKLFELEPSTENFQAMLALTPTQNREQTLNAAVKQAEQADNGTLAANLLLELGYQEKALHLLLRMGTQLKQYYYGDLLALAENFKERNCPLGSIVCYRALLEDILDRAYSKAYFYAADYLKNLLTLDRSCNDYLHLPKHGIYLQRLRQRHSEKVAFWKRVDGSSWLTGL